ncbi:MAG: hypothetical protein SNJ59_17470, partial [Aggregatilineales bacterium]
MSLYGLNILAQTVRDRRRLLHVVEDLKPKVLVVMDDMGLAAQLRASERMVIHRAYHPEDAEFHRRLSPREFADAYLVNVPDGVYVQVLNEPNTYTSAQANAQLARWLVDVINLANARGIRVCVANFAVGHPAETFLTAFDPLLAALHHHPQHVLGVHEYAQISMKAEQSYHIGRFQALLSRCRALHLRPARIVV